MLDISMHGALVPMLHNGDTSHSTTSSFSADLSVLDARWLRCSFVNNYTKCPKELPKAPKPKKKPTEPASSASSGTQRAVSGSSKKT